jgi:hypothetical protein
MLSLGNVWILALLWFQPVAYCIPDFSCIYPTKRGFQQYNQKFLSLKDACKFRYHFNLLRLNRLQRDTCLSCHGEMIQPRPILLTRSYKPWCPTLILSNAAHHLEMGILFRNLGETLGGPVYEYDIKRCASTKNFFLQLYSKSGCILGTEIRTRTPIDSNHS